MSSPVYDAALTVLFHPGWYLTEEASAYVYEHLDPNDEVAVRHVLRYLCPPVHEASDAAARAATKAALRWYVNCADDDRLRWVIDSLPDWPVEYANDPRRTYIWMWQELFGDEPWSSDEVCDDELVTGNPPAGAIGDNRWSPPIDDRVLFFPRKDGLPPGTDAPPVNKEVPRR